MSWYRYTVTLISHTHLSTCNTWIFATCSLWLNPRAISSQKPTLPCLSPTTSNSVGYWFSACYSPLCILLHRVCILAFFSYKIITSWRAKRRILFICIFTSSNTVPGTKGTQYPLNKSFSFKWIHLKYIDNEDQKKPKEKASTDNFF